MSICNDNIWVAINYNILLRKAEAMSVCQST